MEVLCLHGLNIVKFHLVTGRHWFHAVGCYIDPDNTSAIEYVVTAISRQPRGAELLVSSNFNAGQADPEGSASAEEISAALVTSRLEDVSVHFLLINKSW